jgi:hypothetical protein
MHFGMLWSSLVSDNFSSQYAIFLSVVCTILLVTKMRFNQVLPRDSLRHFGYQAEQVFYNGLKQDTLLANKSLTTNGIHSTFSESLPSVHILLTSPNYLVSLFYPDWAKTGIVGRGVLLDFYAYAQRHDIEYDPYSQYGITLEQLKAIQAEEGVEFQDGDILLIRFGTNHRAHHGRPSNHLKFAIPLCKTGHIVVYNSFSDERKREVAKIPHTWAGIGQSKDVLEWIWDNHFAALAGDSPAFETTREYVISIVVVCIHVMRCNGSVVGRFPAPPCYSVWIRVSTWQVVAAIFLLPFITTNVSPIFMGA